jgi:transcriptional regulator with XRE-family HTH domain
LQGYVVVDPEAIRNVMSRTGMTATDVARAGGVSKRHVQNMARGDRTRVSTGVVELVAERLGVPVGLIVAKSDAERLSAL